MKKLSILFFALSLIFVSCSSDDDNNISPATIVGTWKLTSDIEDGVEYVEVGDCPVLYIFTESTITIEEYDGANCDELFPNSDPTWSYSIENNVIIGFDTEEFQGQVDTYDYAILELTESTLKIQYEETGYINTIIMVRQ